MEVVAIKNITFRNLTLLTVFVVYIIFSISLFVFFNNFYIRSTRTEFIDENKGAVGVFEKLMREEVSRLYLESKIFANDRTIYNAFVSKVYIDISKPTKDLNSDEFNIVKTSKITRYKFINLANRIKNKIGRNFGSKTDKEVGFFNLNGKLLGYTSEFKDIINNSDIETYIKKYSLINDDGFI